ncbi:uncharacterized protein LOC121635302 isoform X2 [Melanotaenia boesemani]|uniref:uncharacterized protein LOC121635302 isoform X2 n=1 Tax=Melanotaenia boesemani TaxID=1250792 RepID=UPI001C057806|nr:uncharacterized protein LOC121635302 isoform X2 [Melanotaenia boesemani]
MDLMMMMMMVVVVLVCAETEKVTEVRGELGTDVTLNCSIRDGDVYWSMMIHSQLKVQIGRSFSPTKTRYCSPELETKYLVLGNRLEIKNVTAEDCRLYFCSRMMEDNMVSVDTFRLISDVPVTLTTESDHHSWSSNTETCWSEPVLLSSFSLNAVLLFIIMGFLCVNLRMKSSRCRMKNPPDFSPENPEMLENLQCEEIHLLSSPALSTCVYYQAQHPLPGCRQTHLDRWVPAEEYGSSGEKTAS